MAVPDTSDVKLGELDLETGFPNGDKAILRSPEKAVFKTTLAALQQTILKLYHNYSDLVARADHQERERVAYQRLFDDAPMAYLVTDWEGQLLRVNQEALRFFGLKADEWSGRSLTELITIDAQPVLKTNLAHLQQQGGHCELEMCLRSELDRAVYGVFRIRTVGDAEEPLHWQVWDASQRKQAEFDLHQRIEREHLTNLVIQRIRQSLDPRQILHNTVTEVIRVLQADRVVIYSDESGSLKAIAEAVKPGWDSLLGADLQPLAVDLATQLEALGEPWVLDDVATLPNLMEMVKLLQRQQIQAMVTVPITREGHLLGVLSVHQCESMRVWQGFEIDLLRQLGDQVAIALHHSRMYERAQQLNANLEEEVQRRTEQIGRVLKYESMLKRITDKVRDSLDENQILQAAVQELTVVLELSGCNAALYNLDENTSTILYEYTDSIPASYGKVSRMEDSPDIYRQLKDGLSFQFCSLYPNPMRGSLAMLACPIFVDPDSSEGIDQTVLGDLWLLHEKGYVFNDSDIRLVQQVANQCAIAIRQARLYRAAKAQVEELERLNQLKDQFLSTVSHELRTPIANLKMALHMLQLSTSQEKKQQYLKILESELAREADLINDLLDLQRLEESVSAIAVEPIHLPSWALKVVDPFRTRMQTYRQTFSIHCPPELPILASDPQILQRILAELLNNACKYTPVESGIHLEVTGGMTTPSGIPGIQFRLSNQAEIPASELPHIFEKFYRVLQVDRYKHGGTGLGLALVQKLAEQLKTTITVESEDGWTHFTLLVPQQAT
nr:MULTISPECIES: GAF domain-containing protein [unclassified Leptolyngbya]